MTMIRLYSLGGDGDDEICASGSDHFTLPSPTPTPKSRPPGWRWWHSRWVRIDLGGQEAVDAAGEVLGRAIGEEPAKDGDPSTPNSSTSGAPAMKYITHQENSTSEACPKSGCKASSTTVTIATLAEMARPGGLPTFCAEAMNHAQTATKAGLQELGRLHRHPARQTQPAHRALCRNRCR